MISSIVCNIYPFHGDKVRDVEVTPKGRSWQGYPPYPLVTLETRVLNAHINHFSHFHALRPAGTALFRPSVRPLSFSADRNLQSELWHRERVGKVRVVFYFSLSPKRNNCWFDRREFSRMNYSNLSSDGCWSFSRSSIISFGFLMLFSYYINNRKNE